MTFEDLMSGEKVDEIDKSDAPTWLVNIPLWVKEVETVFEAYHKESSLVREKVRGLAEMLRRYNNENLDLKKYIEEVDAKLEAIMEKEGIK